MALEDNRADAGVVERLNGLVHERNYRASLSPVILDPRALVFAAPKNRHADLLDAIDGHLISIKSDGHSVYYSSLSKWLGQSEKDVFPAWLPLAIIAVAGVVLFFFLANLYLNQQVRIKTREIGYKTRQPPEIDVQVETGPETVVVSVRDNSVGIDAEYHEIIFNIFQRLHSQEGYPGTGIGLAAVRKTAEMLHGRVSVVSEPGKGSTFKLELPKAVQ